MLAEHRVPLGFHPLPSAFAKRVLGFAHVDPMNREHAQEKIGGTNEPNEPGVR